MKFFGTPEILSYLTILNYSFMGLTFFFVILNKKMDLTTKSIWVAIVGLVPIIGWIGFWVLYSQLPKLAIQKEN
ncbi:hypothetical protein [Sphingobacterium kyonggiense]